MLITTLACLKKLETGDVKAGPLCLWTLQATQRAVHNQCTHDGLDWGIVTNNGGRVSQMLSIIKLLHRPVS